MDSVVVTKAIQYLLFHFLLISIIFLVQPMIHSVAKNHYPSQHLNQLGAFFSYRFSVKMDIAHVYIGFFSH